MNQLQHEQYRKVNQSESTWLTTAKAARMHCRWSSKTYFLCQEAPASCGCLLIQIDWLKSSEFRRLEIDCNDAHYNQANRKGGAYGENFFYSARKILFRDKPAAQRTFSTGIWTIHRWQTVCCRFVKDLRLTGCPCKGAAHERAISDRSIPDKRIPSRTLPIGEASSADFCLWSRFKMLDLFC